jgi:ABC-type polysaccharide/polyol phosphate export permease
LFAFIAARLVLQVYRRATLGAWLVIHPTIAVVALACVVGKVLGISTAPVPLAVFAVVGLSLWRLFHRGLRHGTRRPHSAR